MEVKNKLKTEKIKNTDDDGNVRAEKGIFLISSVIARCSGVPKGFLQDQHFRWNSAHVPVHVLFIIFVFIFLPKWLSEYIT